MESYFQCIAPRTTTGNAAASVFLMLMLVCFSNVPACSGQNQASHDARRHSPLSPRSESLTGNYTRIKHRKDENQSATLQIQQIGNGRIHIHVTALFWPVGQSDAHNGEIEATMPLRNGVAVYTEKDYRLTLRFTKNSVTLTEKGKNPNFGAFVTAAGTYRRAKHKSPIGGANLSSNHVISCTQSSFWQ